MPVDATQPPFARNYRMWSYITEELPALVEANFPADLKRRAMETGPVTAYLNELNARIATALRRSGSALVSNAHLGERYVLRACIVNFRTRLEDVRALPRLVVEIGQDLDHRIRPETLRD